MAERLVLTDARLIDGTGADPVEGTTIVVDGDRIAEIEAGTRRASSRTATVIDCGGRTVLPGLTDAHVHVGAVDVNILEQHRAHLASRTILKTARYLTDTLAQGFTTVRDAGGADAGFKAALAEGLIAGPRLLVSGRPLSQTGGHGDVRRATETLDPFTAALPAGIAGLVVDGVAEVRRGAREQLRLGADQIKLMASGGCMSPTDELETTQFSPGELRAAVEEAQAAGTYVMAHAYSGASVARCIDAGIRSVEHGNLIDADTARRLAEAGTYLVPTLVTYDLLAEQGATHGVPEANLAKIRRAREHGLAALGHAADAGVKIASGSDLLGELQAHKARELALKGQVLDPMAVLVAATRTNAELFGLEDEIGTLQAGKVADLLVVDGDPLQDLSLLADRARLRLIVQGGQVVKDTLGVA